MRRSSGLLDELLVPSFHGHIPHVVADVLRLQQIQNQNFHNQMNFNLTDDSNWELDLIIINNTLPGHEQLCECNTEHFP